MAYEYVRYSNLTNTISYYTKYHPYAGTTDSLRCVKCGSTRCPHIHRNLGYQERTHIIGVNLLIGFLVAAVLFAVIDGLIGEY